jgi:hypothetical protein
VLKRIFGPRRDEVTGGWKKLINGGFHNFFSSPNIIRAIISRNMTREGNVARVGEMKTTYKILFF